jgi:hypothetical protein
MEEIVYNSFEDLNFSSSDDSSEDTIDILELLGLSIRLVSIGNILDYLIISTNDLHNCLPYEDFFNAIIYVLSHDTEKFRNLVLTLSTETHMHRRISLTKNRLLQFGYTIFEGLSNIFTHLHQSHYEEIYQDYNFDVVKEIYHTEANEFNLLTSIFEVVYDRDIPAGGHIVTRHYTRHTYVEDAPEYYDLYDCFFNCIHHYLSLPNKFNIKELRNKMKAQFHIQIKHINRFELLTKIKVIVYEDKIINDKIAILYESNYKSKYLVELVLFNSHYYIFKGIKNNIIYEDLKILSNERIYVFYDFETYLDPIKFHVVPYAMSYCIINNDKIDTSGVIYKTSLNDDMSDKIYNFFHHIVNNKNTILIGFNNGAYDDYILIDILASRSKRLSNVIINNMNRILQFKQDNMISKDAYMFFNTSLQKSVESFKCYTLKGNLDHLAIQTAVYNDKYDEWINIHKDEVINYAYSDVMSLQELYFKAKKTFMKININMNIDNYLTISQMSMKIFCKNFKISKNNQRRNLPILNKDIDDIVRKALIGGRCQIFNVADVNDQYVQSIDVVSLYPYVMMNRKYPYIIEQFNTHKKTWIKPSFHKRSLELNESMFGIYLVKIFNQPKDAIIPNRNKDGTLNWTPILPFETWSDSISLLLLKRYNGIYEILDGYIFDTHYDYIFKDYLNPIMDLKKQQDNHKSTNNTLYNPALRECLKLMMNSLSGKMGQMPINKDKLLTNNIDECEKFIKKYQNTASLMLMARENLYLLEANLSNDQIKIKSPTIISIMIYAYAREYMYDNFITKIKHKYAMDTDSLHFNSDEIHLIDKNLFGDECGQIKLELPNNCYGIYVAKKIYANYIIVSNCSSKEDIKIIRFKFKGVNQMDKYIPINQLNDIKNLINSKNNKEINNLWNKLNDISNIDVLRKLINTQKIYVLCNQIKKVFKASKQFDTFTIDNRYVIKEFPYDGFISL